MKVLVALFLALLVSCTGAATEPVIDSLVSDVDKLVTEHREALLDYATGSRARTWEVETFLAGIASLESDSSFPKASLLLEQLKADCNISGRATQCLTRTDVFLGVLLSERKEQQ